MEFNLLLIMFNSLCYDEILPPILGDECSVAERPINIIKSLNFCLVFKKKKINKF